MAAFNAVAPAHNPPYIAAIRQFRSLLPDTPLIGAFETAFHADMPPEAALYSIPIELSRKYDIRRYGFHGASHEYLSQWAADAMDRTDLRLVTCHLGGSGSLCAVKTEKHRHDHGAFAPMRRHAQQPLRRYRPVHSLLSGRGDRDGSAGAA